MTPWELVSPVTLEGKMIFRYVCDATKAWDVKLEEPLLQRWKKWEQSLPLEQLLPRAITSYQESLQAVELHSFGDGSVRSCATTVGDITTPGSC